MRSRGGGLFWVFVLTCVASTITQLVLCSTLRWPWSLVGGLLLLFVAIPAVNLWANRLARRRRSAKGPKLWEVAANDDSDANTEEDVDGEDDRGRRR